MTKNDLNLLSKYERALLFALFQGETIKKEQDLIFLRKRGMLLTLKREHSKLGAGFNRHRILIESIAVKLQKDKQK